MNQATFDSVVGALQPETHVLLVAPERFGDQEKKQSTGSIKGDPTYITALLVQAAIQNDDFRKCVCIAAQALTQNIDDIRKIVKED